VIEGSNMAECHPVGFQWVMEAKQRGAKVIHVDPRFTRTSAVADLHVPIRAGSDIAFLGGIVNYILENERWFPEYVRTFTNAATIITEEFADTEDLDGLFSGFDPERGSYDNASWQYEGMQATAAGGERRASPTGEQAHGAHGGALDGGDPPATDPTLQHPRCVFQLLKKQYSRYTPEVVERITGIPRDQFLKAADLFTSIRKGGDMSKAATIIYAVGWTQHTFGTQIIRAAAIRTSRVPPIWRASSTCCPAI